MAIRRIDLLSCGNLDKTPMKTLDFDPREFSSMGRSMLLLVWEKIIKRSDTLSAVLYVHYILFKKSIQILGHSWHSLGNFLEKP